MSTSRKSPGSWVARLSVAFVVQFSGSKTHFDANIYLGFRRFSVLYCPSFADLPFIDLLDKEFELVFGGNPRCSIARVLDKRGFGEN